MDLLIAKKDLLRLCSRCQGVADKKATMPALANILLTAAGNILTASATDTYLLVTDVMGQDRMKILWADSDGLIEGMVSKEDEDIGAILDHKYQVYIGGTPADPKPGKPAGPDPIVVVGCSSCGPPPPS